MRCLHVLMNDILYVGDLLHFQRQNCSLEECFRAVSACSFDWGKTKGEKSPLTAADWASWHLHGISKKREQTFSIRNILANRNGYDISNVLHHFLGKSHLVPGFLRTGDPAVHTRSHQGAVPCTADIVDKVIHTGESLSDTDTTTDREIRMASLFISAIGLVLHAGLSDRSLYILERQLQS